MIRLVSVIALQIAHGEMLLVGVNLTLTPRLTQVVQVVHLVESLQEVVQAGGIGMPVHVAVT